MAPGFDLLRTVRKTSQIPIEAKLIHGSIPLWVVGSLYRNGPGQYELQDKNYKHLFDGHALLHKFKIIEGRVFYSNNFLETNNYTKSVKENRLYAVFGTADVCSSLYGRLKGAFKFHDTMDNTNVNIVPFGGEQLYALTETNFICKVDPANLSLKDIFNVTKAIDTASTTIAHPHVEPNGSWITMGMNNKSKKTAYYEFVRFKNDPSTTAQTNITEKGEVIGRVPSSHSKGLSYFHSFGLTENYIVFLEMSLKFDHIQFLKNFVVNKPFSDALIMHRDFQTRIHFINRKTGQVHEQKFVTDPLFAFHHINAFETENEVIIDICAYDANYFDISFFSREGIFTDKFLAHPGLKSIARRITVPFKYSEFSKEPIYCKINDINSDIVFELPNFNYAANNCKQYTYVYGVNFWKLPFSIIKMNVNTGATIEFKYQVVNGRRFLPTEPVFVPNPNGREEDDGVLLVMVLADGHDFLSILSSKDLTELARAEINSDDVKAGFTFHGFFADKHSFPKLND